MADTSSRPTKKTTTKKTATKKSAAKKTPAKKTAPKTAARRPASKSSQPDSQRSGSATPKGSEVAALASRHLLELTGKATEGVIGLQKTDDGWQVEVEVLELRRVPNTTDILATYEVSVDGDGDLVGYRRLHRYVRGTPGEE